MQQIDLTEAIEVLHRGEILIYPTETLYGLGVDFENEAAIQKLKYLKGRDPTKPISLLIPSREWLKKLVQEISPKLLKLIDKFFPGKLTIVLPASSIVPGALHGNSGWIGIRMSSHPLAQKLVQEYGRPITTTSANPSGEEGSQTLAQITEYFRDIPGVYLLTGGDLPPSRGSTVVQVDGNSLKLLREGEIPFTEIEKEFNN